MKNLKTQKSSGSLDYHLPNFSRTGRALAILKSLGVTALISFFFYRSFWAMIPLSGLGYLFYRELRRKQILRNQRELEKQFKENIMSVAAVLKAGYSAENAFKESRQDMVRMFGEKALIVKEVETIIGGLKMNVPLEKLLEDLAYRSGSSHIDRFAQVFEIAKKNGGNMAEVIKSAAQLIGRDVDIRAEADTILGGKRLELGIMRVVPFALIGYIGISNPGYLDSLYGNPKGVLIMTGCLAVYIVAYRLGEKIMEALENSM